MLICTQNRENPSPALLSGILFNFLPLSYSWNDGVSLGVLVAHATAREKREGKMGISPPQLFKTQGPIFSVSLSIKTGFL